ncbi:MAG: glycosyltransferase family 2 protein [Thermoanaerobaculia bacterium]|nr:glycosyltransferase family 2 protein [Thermoanaerobaculia bacterium]
MAEATITKAPESISPIAERAQLRSVPHRADLSIVIVTWNSERWIERCLSSIPAACAGLEYEIVVYDNASSDGTMKLLDGSGGVQLLRGEANDGFAAGANRALAQSSGRYLFLLNPDCELEPSALTSLVAFLDAHPQAAAAAPLLVDESGDSQREFQLRRLPSLRHLASEALLLDKIVPQNRATAHYRYRDLDLTTPQRVEQPAAAALLIRREVVDEIGAFDEQFAPAWFEDVDYCQRLASAKKEIYVVPSAVARHFGGASLEHMPYGEFLDTWYRNMYLYARKWFTRSEAEALRWAIIVGMMLRWIAALAGVRNGSSSRRAALRTYRAIMQKALNQWRTA